MGLSAVLTLLTWGCSLEPGGKNADHEEGARLDFVRTKSGALSICDPNGNCSSVSNPFDCNRLQVAIDVKEGTTCETCYDENESVLYEECGENSVSCLLVNFVEPDCIVCGHVDGPIVYNDCTAEVSSTLCGDGSCDSAETCSSCEADCGSCPSQSDDPDAGAPDAGAPDPAVTIQAEDFSVKSGGRASTGADGYLGAGFFDFAGQGSWVQWDDIDGGSGGSVTLAARYANGHQVNRSVDVYVNDQLIGPLDGAPTGDWSSWATETLVVPLRSGKNSVRFVASAEIGGPNLDQITFSADGAEPPEAQPPEAQPPETDPPETEPPPTPDPPDADPPEAGPPDEPGEGQSPPTPGSSALEESLLGYWPLDGSLVDVTGNNGTGLYLFHSRFSNSVAKPLTFVEGAAGQALDLRADGEREMPYVETGLTFPNDDPKTYSVFVKTSDFEHELVWIGNGAPDGDPQPEGNRAYLGTISETVFVGAGTKVWRFAESYPRMNSAWHHYAVVLGGGTFRVYQDGRLVVAEQSYFGSTASARSTGKYGTSRTFLIGMGGGIDNHPANAIIDDVAVFGRALSAEEIEKIATSGSVAAAL